MVAAETAPASASAENLPDHARHGLCACRVRGMLSVLGARRRQVSGRVQWVCQRHCLVPIRCAVAGRDRHAIGGRAQAGGCYYFRAEIANMGPRSSLEKKAALLMAVAIVLWLTDFLHHISPAIIGMGVGLFALLPRVGILDIEDMKRLNYLPVFFVA